MACYSLLPCQNARSPRWNPERRGRAHGAPGELRVQFADCAKQLLPAAPAGGRAIRDSGDSRCASSTAWPTAYERAGVTVIVADDTPLAGQTRRDIPQQLGELSSRRYGGAVSDAGAEPAQRAAREVLGQVSGAGGFRIARTVDLSTARRRASISKARAAWCSTGCGHVAYASLSPRTDLDVLGEFAQQLDYELVTFEALDGCGQRHLSHQCVDGDRHRFRGGLRRVDHAAAASRCRVFDAAGIGAGNHRDIARRRCSSSPATYWSWPRQGPMSSRCRPPPGAASIPAQRRALERHGRIVAADIPVIERYGGGGVRCMLAEIHLPTRV